MALACREDHTARGDAFARQRRWTEAVQAYKQALVVWAHDYDAAWGIARIYCHEQVLALKCLEWTEKLLEAYPDRGEFRAARAAGQRVFAVELRAEGNETAAVSAEQEAARLER